jgi:hypothetical protein
MPYGIIHREKLRAVIIGLLLIALLVPSYSFATDEPKVGGFKQVLPGESEDIGAGWGHHSMTYGMMNLMSGMTRQGASIHRTGKTTPEMLNYAPAYMMGTKTVDSNMIKQMHEMLKEIEKMCEETLSR